MKGQSVARVLHARLTEEGLKRVIARSSIYNHRYIAELSSDELERLIRIEPLEMSRGGRVIARKTPELKMSRGGRVIARKTPRPKMSRGGRVTVRAGKAAKKFRRRENYWIRFKKEIHILTNDRKYATLRRQFTKGKSQTALVTIICGGIAEYVGGSPTVMMPLVAVALLSFLEVGINAYCAGHR